MAASRVACVISENTVTHRNPSVREGGHHFGEGRRCRGPVLLGESAMSCQVTPANEASAVSSTLLSPAEELANRITHGIGLFLSLVGVAVMVQVPVVPDAVKSPEPEIDPHEDAQVTGIFAVNC